MKTNLKILTVVVAGVLLLGLSGVAAHAGGLVDTTFYPGDFAADSAIIDNPYWALPARTTFVYYTMPNVGDECEINYVWVTNHTVVIEGVKARQVQDWVYVDEGCDGEVDPEDYLSENTLDWYAQDYYGKVWYLGEWTEEYIYDDDGNFDYTSTEGSWKTGVGDAEPGIIMLDTPEVGDFYQQEYLEDEAEDIAKVLQVDASVNLTFNEDNPNDINPGEYEDCLKTKEWSPLELGVVEHKYYCEGKLLLVNELQGGTVRTELVEIIDGPPPAEVKPPKLTPDF